MSDKMYDIPAASARIGFSQSYVRTLIRRGTLISEMVPLSKGSLVTKHMISESELQRFLEEVPHKSRRHDSRNKFVLYATPDEIAPLLDAMRNAGFGEIADLVEPANQLAYWPLREKKDG